MILILKDYFCFKIFIESKNVHQLNRVKRIAKDGIPGMISLENEAKILTYNAVFLIIYEFNHIQCNFIL